ncbi:MAG: hypothetical protein ACRDP3_16835 [Streptomyces sp.]|uniref:hypothetical protein n=1 Tax=Streptomyces sp. TaxID=1931 RepID=UPI003D6AA60E
MPSWGLIVEETCGYQDRRWEATHLGEFDGTRQQALTRLLKFAKTYEPAHPRLPKRRLVYEAADGYIVFVRGATETFHLRFSVAELVHDTYAPARPQGRPEPAAEPEDAVPANHGRRKS